MIPANPVWIDGLPIQRCRLLDIADTITTAAKHGDGGILATVNLQFLALARRDRSFRSLLLGCRYLVADGMPLIWASRIAGDPLPERLSGVDVMQALIKTAAAQNVSVYLLGGRPGAAAASADIWRQRHPHLRIAGVRCPPLGFDQDPVLLKAEIDAIVMAAPGIVFVALGCPRQERFAVTCRDAHASAWLIGIGGSFDFVAGHTSRAPRFLQRIGLEWLHRMLHEPRRLIRRYLMECLPVGVSLLLRAAYGHRRRES